MQKALVVPSKRCGYTEIITRPVPTPGPGQLLVKIHSAGIGLVDWGIRDMGILVDGYGYPIVLGNDGAGTIEGIARDVQGWKLREKVYVVFVDLRHFKLKLSSKGLYMAGGTRTWRRYRSMSSLRRIDAREYEIRCKSTPFALLTHF